MIYQNILTEHERLGNLISTIQEKLKTLPKGKLSCSISKKGHSKWYQTFGSSRNYIPKSNRLLAERLAVKTYFLCLLEDSISERTALKFYLNHHKSTKKSEQLLLHPEFQKLRAPYYAPLSQELTDWAHDDYQHNPKYTDFLTFNAVSGIKVRSKSEALIDMILYTNNIPFRYECALQLGNITIYPDFTIRHPKTGEYYYWEHHGRMDEPAYAQKASQKLQTYIANGIIPTISLINTFETLDHPLDPVAVQEIVDKYFL